MTTPTSKITINDGTTSIDITGFATISGLRISTQVLESSSILRHLDGTAEKHTLWSGKRRIEIRADGWRPPEIDTIDYSKSLTLTVPHPTDPTEFKSYTVLAVARPTQEWNMKDARFGWSLECEEI